MNNKEKWKLRTPLLVSTSLLIVSLYFFLRVWAKIAALIMGEIKSEEIIYGWGLFGSNTDISIFTVILSSIFVALSWLLSTRIKVYTGKFLRFVTFVLAILTIWGNLALFGMSQVHKSVIPFFQDRLLNVIETDSLFQSIVLEQTDGFYLMLLLIPLIVMFFISLFLVNKYIQFDKEINLAFFDFQWNGRWLQRFSNLEKIEKWPDIELGANSKTKEMVVLPGRDRTLNTLIIGSIGTGKTAALAQPMINQDLHHITRFINDYPSLYQRDDFLTEEVGGSYLNGISIIEPSNDLCQKALKLVKAHGIPDEAITYINPLDPNTPSINPMRGPVDKVAEVFAQVIAGLDDSKTGGSFYFEQAQRNHLKHYIYLLKLHDQKIEVTFDMLLDMYNNPQLVRSMHVKLKTTFPPDIDLIQERDERNYWKIVQGIDEWFDLNLLPLKDKQGFTERDDNDDPVYYDAKAEHVQGLRNILNDIGANPLIRRVLFGKSDFDFDRHMANGGILLVNTAKGELVNLARVLGKIVLMNLQNASFRRPPMVSPFHHILIDEAPDYLYNAFREFPAQSRKYKVIITTLKQTIAQLADQFGEHYMTTLIGTMRNRMVYGDVPAYDADYFSKMFGEKFTYEEGQSEQSVSPLQDSPLTRSGSSYSKVREGALSPGDIMYQDAFECAVKLVKDNKPMPVVQIRANFVPKDEFSQSKFVVDEDSLEVWLQQRSEFGLQPNLDSKTEEVQMEQIESIEESEEKNAELYEDERNSAFSINEKEMEEVLAVKVDPRPRNPVNYLSHRTPVSQSHKKEELSVKKDSIAVQLMEVEPEKEPARVEEVKLKNGTDYHPSELPQEAEEFASSLVKSIYEEVDK
ncbi:type IV secretory system conjugative DNA transfer family protein [Cytobacillus gottheilii]|uniref:type IV secretory system conjugative DNA transfer family protein n=1 Tax=Cytobacillus gottheilii TaxID=859144 RepID=UPI002494AD15|nr:TraM recognition domain-containing protein [Cytobacillus gottheilii]